MEEQKFAERNLSLRLGETVPDFEAIATHGGIRLVGALQTADKHRVTLPANWRPRENLSVNSPFSTQDLAG